MTFTSYYCTEKKKIQQTSEHHFQFYGTIFLNNKRRGEKGTTDPCSAFT